METVEPNYFEEFVNESVNHAAHPDAIDLKEKLKIGSTLDFWMPFWMKVNFSNAD